MQLRRQSRKQSFDRSSSMSDRSRLSCRRHRDSPRRIKGAKAKLPAAGDSRSAGSGSMTSDQSNHHHNYYSQHINNDNGNENENVNNPINFPVDRTSSESSVLDHAGGVASPSLSAGASPDARCVRAEKSRRRSPENVRRISRERRKRSSSTLDRQDMRKTSGLLPKSATLGEKPDPVKSPATQESRRGGPNTVNPADVVTTGVCLQPETHPITEEQLVNEVRGIYAGLVMVEKKCIEIDRQQSESTEELTDAQWQALTALHRTLLHEHHDFFLASNHPAASTVLRKLAEKYAMPARMWRYGIHSFLELLRHRLPGSLEHMLTFIYIAYSMMTLLLESVPSFEETWIECLGDLARYRMAVEEKDMRDREVWSGVARYWYNKAADKNPGIGRIQHHLAVLARPNILQQLFYYSKSLVSVQPFLSTRDSILLLFNPLLDPAKPVSSRYPPILTAFVCTHGFLFTRGKISAFIASADQFLSDLDKYIGRIGAVFREQGVYIVSSNYAAIFDFGQPDAVMPSMFDQKVIQESSSSERFESAKRMWESHQSQSPDQSVLSQRDGPWSEDDRFSSSIQVLSFASHLAFSTLRIILERIGDKNVLPSVHLSLAFLWSAALVPTSMTHIEADVPWVRLASFLNTLIRPDMDMSKVEDERFPSYETGSSRQLPEDFLIRGQAWSQLYYPEGFFDETADEEERSIELPSVVVPRTHRCLWLGWRIASFKCWITYDSERKLFLPTPFAYELENAARGHNPLDLSRARPEALQSSQDNDTLMTGT
ncbi:hypothetical protein VTN77DRAFT_2897 [Rasamsonia byssochlamydoides]|uniref:uncharacterized protein n=1 Tax=Rasamsonia byssochlamydoides TaxID=89139 RepID=UPI003742AD58